LTKFLIRWQSDFKAMMEMGKMYNPLFRAIERQDIERIRTLIGKGVDLNKSLVDHASRVPRSPLFMAVSHGVLDAVNTLLMAGAHANGSRDDWTPPLISAAQTNRVDIIKALIAAGANVNIQTRGRKAERGKTPLIYAVGAQQEVVARLLLDLGADAKISTAIGVNALTEAAHIGNLALCKLLIDAGSPANGNAVLKAVFSGNDEVLHLVLKHGGDPNYIDNGAEFARLKGFNPLGASLMLGPKLGGKSSTALLLLKFGSDPNLLMQSIPPLHRAAGLGYVNVVRKLLQAGAKPEAMDHGGLTALAWAVKNAQAEVIKVLQKAGASTRRRGKRSNQSAGGAKCS
jgi:uncharacterized protein